MKLTPKPQKSYAIYRFDNIERVYNLQASKFTTASKLTYYNDLTNY